MKKLNVDLAGGSNSRDVAQPSIRHQPATALPGADVRALLDAERIEQCTPSRKVPGCFESESLCRWQANVYRRGFRGARLTKTIFGWSVRSDTGLDNFAILAGHRDGSLPNATYEQALEWARQWQADDPTRRYVLRELGEEAQ